MLLIEDMVAEVLLLSHVRHSKLPTKQKEPSFQKIAPLQVRWTWKDGKCPCSRVCALLECPF